MKVTVNCWFCNENCKVPFKEQNGFVCPRCEQYNGFTEDGGYNKDLPEQRMEYMNKYISPTKKVCFHRFSVETIQREHFYLLIFSN
ncbi:unnamed protein product [Anisakis simplex]|uniref:Transmembrane protein 201 (inferred by orthology to a human protein) n=1 Tax=Anisakis simplex TaxID=6269 RepID=A0A0M3JLR1_ANISI|nr:unnamed protein product [Anisakis simplex]